MDEQDGQDGVDMGRGDVKGHESSRGDSERAEGTGGTASTDGQRVSGWEWANMDEQDGQDGVGRG